MKNQRILKLVLSASFLIVPFFVSAGTAGPGDLGRCSIENYRDFISKEAIYHCKLREANLRFADLENADLRFADLQLVDLEKANLQLADLREANLWKTKVTKEQAEYLRSKGFSGFVIID